MYQRLAYYYYYYYLVAQNINLINDRVMKKRMVLSAFFVLAVAQASAQMSDPVKSNLFNSFDRCAQYYGDVYDIELTQPKQMIDREWCDHLLWFSKENITSRDGLAFILESEDRNFLVTCSMKDVFKEGSTQEPFADSSGWYALRPDKDNCARARAASEVASAYGYIEMKRAPGYFTNHQRTSGMMFTLEDFNTYVKVYTGKKVRRWFNADSVYVYALPGINVFSRGPGVSMEPALKPYVYCTGMIIFREGRAGVPLKLFFTNEGKRNEQKYLRMLPKMVWYRDDDWQFDREKQSKRWPEILANNE